MLRAEQRLGGAAVRHGPDSAIELERARELALCIEPPPLREGGARGFDPRVRLFR